MPIGGALRVREVSSREVETLNLRTYGWARDHVFGKTQATLDGVRIASRRRPAQVVRPKPFPQVFLIESDPEDNSLSTENQRRGWPPKVPNASGRLCDYIVIPVDAPHPDLWERANELAEHRARKRAGIGPTDELDGHIATIPLHPLDMRN
jgi:hypothetical protein